MVSIQILTVLDIVSENYVRYSDWTGLSWYSNGENFNTRLKKALHSNTLNKYNYKNYLNVVFFISHSDTILK